MRSKCDVTQNSFPLLSFPSHFKKQYGVHSQNLFLSLLALLLVEPDDLVKYGLIPEFIGRLPIVASVSALDEDALIRVLTQPRNALSKQYERLFELDEVQLVFEDEALASIAALAMERGTGARGLRAILEDVLLPAMYDIPGREDVEKVVITAATVQNGEMPLLVTRGAKKERKDKSA